MVRRSAKLTDARKKARERAAVQIEREESLLRLAEDFIVAEESLGSIEASLQDQIDKINERAERDRARARGTAKKNGEDLRAGQARVADEMVELGAKPTDVAARLGVSAGDLRKLRALDVEKMKEEPPAEPSDSVPAPTESPVVSGEAQIAPRA